MRAFNFIHSAEDVPHVLSVAAGAGLIIRDGEPTAEPGPIILRMAQYSDRNSGQFVGYRDDWLFGDLPVYEIAAGAYQGKFDISPGTNVAGIDFYFMGERQSEDGDRLGDGVISWRLDWYSPKDHEVYLAPPEVEATFDTIRKRLDTGKRVRAGGRTYHLLEGALHKMKKGYLPPFDFIEWPVELR